MGNPVQVVQRLIERADAVQQRHPVLAFPFAVFKKFGDDQGGNLAALIAYYGFFSLLPLMLVFISVLGFVLHGNPHLQARITHSAFTNFPILGDQIQRNVHSLHGSGIGLAIGLAGTLYGGLGVANAAQNALNDVWETPMATRPNLWLRLARSLLILLVIGLGILASTFLGGVSGGSGALGAPARVAALLLATVVNTGLFVLAFRLLTARDVAWRDLVPGALVAAVLWDALQALGGYYVAHTLKGASQTYGFFAIVIGLLSWLYLEAQVVLLAAEVNVVRAWRLWPRSLTQPPLTEADKRSLRAYATVEERRPEESVDVAFDERARDRVPNPSRGNQ